MRELLSKIKRFLFMEHSVQEITYTKTVYVHGRLHTCILSMKNVYSPCKLYNILH